MTVLNQCHQCFQRCQWFYHPTIISGISSELSWASSCWSVFGSLSVIALAEPV